MLEKKPLNDGFQRKKEHAVQPPRKETIPQPAPKPKPKPNQL